MTQKRERIVEPGAGALATSRKHCMHIKEPQKRAGPWHAGSWRTMESGEQCCSCDVLSPPRQKLQRAHLSPGSRSGMSRLRLADSFLGMAPADRLRLRLSPLVVAAMMLCCFERRCPGPVQHHPLGLLGPQHLESEEILPPDVIVRTCIYHTIYAPKWHGLQERRVLHPKGLHITDKKL